MQIDFQSPEFIADPYPTYAILREQAPVYQLESGSWLITRYQDVEYLLKSPRLNKDIPSIMFNQRYRQDMSEEPVYRFHNHFWGMMDTPHRRKLIVKAVNARRIGDVRTLVQESADKLVDQWIAAGQVDLLQVFAYALPIQVTCRTLDIELEQSLDFLAEIKLILRPGEPNPLSEAELAACNAAALRLNSFFGEICRQRRQQPGDDLVSQLLSAEENGERLSDEDVICNLIMLFVSGYGTTANALCNILRLLFLYPEQRELLKARPELLANAVEEGLRFSSSGPMTFRTAMEAFEFNGVRIEPGDALYLSLDSANHDPEAFTDPDRFWIERPDLKKSLAFGLGSHYCLGAKLGAMEVEVALETLFRRLPNLTVDNADRLQWEPTWVLRGLQSLPVRW
jgi:cytochrome P450